MDTILYCDVGNTAIDMLVEGKEEKWDHFYPLDKERMLSFLDKSQGKKTAYVSCVSYKNLVELEEVLLPLGFSLVRLTRERMHLLARRNDLSIGNLDILGEDLFCDILQAGRNSIVVDFGTATKILAVDRDGLFLGGSILPGIPSFPKVLFQKADLLPDMSLTDENVPLLSLKTEECIASGAIHGTTFLVEGYLKRLQQRKGLEGAQVLFTGGNFHYVERNLANKGKYVRTLPLLGLKKAFSL